MMKTKLTKLLWVMLGMAFLTVGALMGEESTNVLLMESSMEPVPKSVFEFWTLGIALLSPLLVWLIYKAVPKIPKLLLPSMTPFIGIALGFILKWVGAANLSWIDMAQAGALAVFIREVFNQAVTKNMDLKEPGEAVGTRSERGTGRGTRSSERSPGTRNPSE